MSFRQRGFTLVELLVVLAIMGLLTALLFPVLARARESARRTQCLSSVKNVTAAVTMYVADWDGFWPPETSRAALDYFNAAPGGGDPHAWPESCERSYQANPYLRVAPLLDEYVPNRQVWRCPGAAMDSGASLVVSPPAEGDWLSVWQAREGRWGKQEPLGPCYTAWPPGWGGTVTDSFSQGGLAVCGEDRSSQNDGAFVQSIGVNEHLRWQQLSSVRDPSRHIVCGDAGTHAEVWTAEQLAYPDTCGLGYSGESEGRLACRGADWENCAWTRACGLTEGHLRRFYEEPGYRHAAARHGGGSNVGFLDGHAKWYPADDLLVQSQPFRPAYFEGGLCVCWPVDGVVHGEGTAGGRGGEASEASHASGHSGPGLP